MQAAFSLSENIFEHLPFGTELGFRDALMKHTHYLHTWGVGERREADGDMPGCPLCGGVNVGAVCYRVHPHETALETV